MVKTDSVFLKFITDEYRAEIGQVIVQWSILETSIEAAIWQAASTRNDVGRTFTAQLGMQAKIDLLTSMLHQTYPNLAPAFENVAIYIRNCLIGKRNLIIHGMWWQEGNFRELASVLKFSARGRLTSQGGIMTIAELKDLYCRIAELSEWMLTLYEKLPPLQQRPDGLGHKTPDIPPPQNCANLRERALQPIPSQA